MIWRPIVVVVVPAATQDLTTVAAVRAELGADGPDDAALAAHVRQASAAIASYCGRSFGLATVEETHRLGRAVAHLHLTRRPVTSINMVVEQGSTLAPAEYEADAVAGLLYRLDGDRRRAWPWGTIEVTYTAGYALPDEAPPDLARAAIVLVTAFVSAAGRDPALRSESVDGIGSSSWMDPSNGGGAIPEAVRALLAPYREVRFG